MLISEYHNAKLTKSFSSSFFSAQVGKIIKPMLAHKTRDIKKARFPAAVEVKYDGIRAIVEVTNGRASIQTRDGKDWTSRYSNLAYHLSTLPDGLYDGEIYIPGIRGPDQAVKVKYRGEVVFVAFDIPGRGSWLERRHKLTQRVGKGNGRIRISKIVGVAQDLKQAAILAGREIKKGEEGVILKPLDSQYYEGERREWVKIKIGDEHE